MKRFATYDPATGELVRLTLVQDEIETVEPLDPAHAVIQIEDYDCRLPDAYVDLAGPDIAPRDNMLLTFSAHTAPADGATEIVVTGIPTGAKVTADLPDGWAEEVVEDGQVEIVSTTPGIATLRVLHYRYLDEVVEVEFV